MKRYTRLFSLVLIYILGYFAFSSMFVGQYTNCTLYPLISTSTTETTPSSADIYHFGEKAWVNISPEGWIYAEYNFYGPNVQLSGLNLDLLKEMFPEFFELFSWGTWYFSPGQGNPWDQNANIELRFETNDPVLARNHANWLMGFINAFYISSFTERSLFTYDDWNGVEWVIYTVIQYDAHTDWPILLSEYNNLIPRTVGGLAETINISTATELRASFVKGNDAITNSFGVGWSGQVNSLKGGFHFSIKDLIHVTTLQKAPEQGDPLNLGFQLPNIANLSVSSGAQINYHPPLESWNLYNHYDISIQITSSVTDFWVDFDYQFIPWDLQAVEEAHTEINPYGYQMQMLSLNHKNAYLIDWKSQFSGISELLEIRTSYSFEPWLPTTIAMRIRIQFNYTRSFEPEIDALANWIDMNYDWIQSYNASWEAIYWTGDEGVPSIQYELLYDTGLTKSTWSNLWQSTWISSHSQMFMSSDIASADTIEEVYYYRGAFGGYYVQYLNVVWTALDQRTEFPVKTFSEGSGITHQLNLPEQFGWTTVNFSSDFVEARIGARVPCGLNSEDFVVLDPPYSGGWGYDWFYWDSYMNGIRYREVIFELQTNNAHYNESSVQHFVHSLNAQFNYQFHADTDDLIAPGCMIGWYNATLNRPVFQWDAEFYNKQVYSGIERITGNAWDSTSNLWWEQLYWNGTQENSDDPPRYGISGIANMSLDLYFASLPIYHEDFHWSYPMIYITNGYWYSDIDTTELSDGRYTVIGTTQDGVGNSAATSMEINIDNYPDESSSPPSISWISPTPLNGSFVGGGNTTIRIQLSDDIEVFAATFTIDGSAYVLDDSLKVAEGIYEFIWNTWQEGENSLHLFTVKVWDVEGHSTFSTYVLGVDKYPIGNPPVIIFFNPSVDMQLLDGLVTFLANITDDVGISSVQARIDTRAYSDMFFNETSEFWTYSYNVSTLVNGTHQFTVQVIDMDENQHTTPVTINFWVNTTITELPVTFPPEWQNVLPGNFTSAADIKSGEIIFSIKVKDDIGIETVTLKLSTVDGVNITALSDPDAVDIQNRRIVSGFPTNMIYNQTSDGWDTYTKSWDSQNSPTGLYLAEMVIADQDTDQHQINLQFLVIVNNDEGNPFAQIAGYSTIWFIAICTFTISTIGRRFSSRRLLKKMKH